MLISELTLSYEAKRYNNRIVSIVFFLATGRRRARLAHDDEGSGRCSKYGERRAQTPGLWRTGCSVHNGRSSYWIMEKVEEQGPRVMEVCVPAYHLTWILDGHFDIFDGASVLSSGCFTEREQTNLSRSMKWPSTGALRPTVLGHWLPFLAAGMTGGRYSVRGEVAITDACETAMPPHPRQYPKRRSKLVKPHTRKRAIW